MDNKKKNNLQTGSLFTHFKSSGLSKEESDYVKKHPKEIPASLKDVEDKIYMISFNNLLRDGLSLFFGDEYDEEKLMYEYETHMCVGRRNAFNIIKEYFEHDGEGGIDIDKSFVLVEGLPLEKRVSLYRFILLCNQKYEDTLDIDYYIRTQHEDESNDEDNKSQATGNGTAGTLLNN